MCFAILVINLDDLRKFSSASLNFSVGKKVCLTKNRVLIDLSLLQWIFLNEAQKPLNSFLEKKAYRVKK